MCLNTALHLALLPFKTVDIQLGVKLAAFCNIHVNIRLFLPPQILLLKSLFSWWVSTKD